MKIYLHIVVSNNTLQTLTSIYVIFNGVFSGPALS